MKQSAWLFRCFLLLFLLFIAAGQAFEIKPWFGRDKEFYLRVLLDDQYYRRFQNGHKSVYLPSNSLLIGASVEASPSPEWDFEVEAMAGTTRQHDHLFDHAALTARYLLLDDVIGDPVSLTAGLTAMFPTRQSVRDYSLFHCGEYEYLAHLSVGRESSCEKFWTSRWWGTVGMGFANRGSPWTRLHVAWEKNWCDCQQCYLFADSILGWGSRDVHLENKFRGYGAIKHRAVDLGIGYSVLTDGGDTVSLTYAYRVYAHNRPAGAQLFFLTVKIPFSPIM